MKQDFIIDRIKDALWIVAIAGMVAGLGRFVFGLGAATNMTDALPWGMWKILNMVAGAALATSGFIVAAIIYIFRIEKYRPLGRLAVAIGFLGYGASLFALLFDIGLPHRGWHPFLMWNPHSFLFEVFWCVSCYWFITAYEMVPVLTERFPFPRLTHFMHEIALPFIVLGVTLSTMHHSSLGSLFMVSPTRLYPLWHTTWIPIEFFTSAMGAGMSVIVLVAIIYGWLWGKGYNMSILSGMARASAYILLVYLGIKVVDFTIHGKWNYVFGPDITWETFVFWVEISLQALIPIIIILFIPGARKTLPGLVIATSSASAGVLMHRLDTGIVGYFRDAGMVYIPTFSELLFSLGAFAAAGIVFIFFLEHFYIMDAPEECHVPEAEGAHPDTAPQWTIAEARKVFTGPHAVRIALIFVVVIPVTVLMLSNQATGPFEWEKQPVKPPLALDEARTVLLVDGNREDMNTAFPHEYHMDLVGESLGFARGQKEAETCAWCHHLDMPKDHSTACYKCHRDMYLETSIFDHELHQDYYDDAESCNTCHNPNLPKGPGNVKETCMDCHERPAEGELTEEEEALVMNGLSEYGEGKFSFMAPGYKYAMHGKCLTCHRLYEKASGESPAEPRGIGNCRKCHPYEGEAEPFTAMAK